MTEPTRPLLRYHGGKWVLAPWIISHFPKHQVYTECFGGAASVLARKPISYAEVYNDKDDEIVNMMRVVRGDRAHELVAALRLTPYARTEFYQAYDPCDDVVERARRLVIRSFMGFGGDGACGQNRTGFRANSNRSGSTPAHDWVNYPDALELLVERFRRVIVEHRDAIEIIAQHDSETTLHYVDPPYVHATRTGSKAGKQYRHELDDSQHLQLLKFLRDLQGMVVLSGYRCDLYDDLLGGWHRIDRAALADGALKRTESLWLNPACVEALNDGPLFEAAA